MLKVTDLRKTFLSGDSEVYAVMDIDFEVPEGMFAAIVGRSGSGKSSLLALLGGLDKATGGTIMVGSKDITKMSDRQLTEYRRKTIGFVFQQYNLVPNLTALENVMLPMEFAGVSPATRRQRAMELLEQVGLDATKQGRRPSHLSGGEQQRVAIARALANRPKLILADEPTGNLHSSQSEEIMQLFQRLNSEGTTIIQVTHSETNAAYGNRVIQLRDGWIIDTNQPKKS